LIVALLACVGFAAPATAAPKKKPHLKLGTLTLHRCPPSMGGWCGSLPRALDPAKPHGPRIKIGFQWLPPRHKSNKPALVAVEGGPGYPSSGSLFEYDGIFHPLIPERGLLLVDNRGTGMSALINCKDVQNFAGRSSGPAFAKRVARCAAQLNKRYPHVNAADLFGTAYAAEDFSAVLKALRLGKVDLYGDSYGTWFVQSFIARHPDQLHSVTLDSAYPVVGLDPWYASSGPVAKNALDAVCARDLACAASASGSASDRLGQLLNKLRAAPITGTSRDSDGTRGRVRVTVRNIVDLVQDAASDPVIYRELDPSVRAALAGDNVPLLRLALQSGTYDHGTSTALYFTDGLYFAVSCVDYPQLFNMGSSPAQRRAEYAASVANPPAGNPFAPFTSDEWLTMSAYDEPYQACLDWPAPKHSAPPVPPGTQPLPANIPILIMGGDLDSLTPEPDVEKFGPTLGQHVRIVKLRNAVHVSSEGDTLLLGATNCARRIIRSYIRHTDQLDTIDATCADKIPTVHTAGSYPALFANVAPATLLDGHDPGEAVRRAATVAAGALGDALIRHFYSGVAHGPGLRGGSFTTKGDGPVTFKLKAIRFVRDVAVTGTGKWNPSTGGVQGDFKVGKTRVKVVWNQDAATATATLPGGAHATLPAP
jgi:pimeloyl-ACP methyl ester carboxylesterase